MEYEFTLRQYGTGESTIEGDFSLTEEQEKFINICQDPLLLISKLNEFIRENEERFFGSKHEKLYSSQHVVIYKKGEDESRFVMRAVILGKYPTLIGPTYFVLSPHNAIVFGNKFGQID